MKIEAMPENHISTVAAEAVRLVAGGEMEVTFDFNEIKMTVHPGTTVEDVCADYDRQSKARHEAYIASPEYKARQAEAETRECEHDRQFRDAMAGAPTAMSIRDGATAEWEHIKETNSKDAYSHRCVTYGDVSARRESSLRGRKTRIRGENTMIRLCAVKPDSSIAIARLAAEIAEYEARRAAAAKDERKEKP